MLRGIAQMSFYRPVHVKTLRSQQLRMAGVLDRNVQSQKMVHAALLLVMLEAASAGPRFTISLKRIPLNAGVRDMRDAAQRTAHLSIGLSESRRAKRGMQRIAYR
jgi:hypothetical protein